MATPAETVDAYCVDWCKARCEALGADAKDAWRPEVRARAQQSSPLERRGDDSFRSRRRGGPTEIGQPLDPPSHRDLTPNPPRAPAGTRRGDDRVPLRRQTRAAVRVPRASARHRASERRERPARVLVVTARVPPKTSRWDRMLAFVRDPNKPVHPLTIGKLVHSTMVTADVAGSLLGVMKGVFTPALQSKEQWPESIRKEFAGGIHRYMAQLTEQTHELRGLDQALRPVGGTRGFSRPRRSRREQGSRAEARVRRHPLDEKDSRSRRRRRPVPG